MSTTSFVNSLISTPNRAQIIHQKGTLIFANTAAAVAFGIGSVQAFAQTTKLFIDAAPAMGALTRTRSLTFRSLDGQRKQALVTEHAISWNGHPSAYLTIDLLSADGDLLSDGDSSAYPISDETYFLDSIDSAMDWSRTDGGSFEASKRPFDFAGVCLRLADDLAQLARQRGVTLNVEIKPRALCLFCGDAAKLVKAASCIVRHAIYRNPGGRVDISLSASEKGDSISVEVSDTGPAYTPWVAVSLLEPAKASHGSGGDQSQIELLDMPLAQCLAQFLGGKVTLKVNHPTGGLIRLRVPFPRVETENRAGMRRAVIQPSLRILVAEDNATSQHVMGIILAALGHQATFVEDGQQ
jgi:hypothetical protein